MAQHDAVEYRPEIDGMRAIAILTVLGFHLGFSDWAGGFVGVDVFFVLSGYLICGQIYGLLLSGDFSALDFFARRIRRLSTAAFACFLVTGITVGMIFLPFEIPFFIQNLLGSITFTNNFLLMQNVGYFAPTANSNPLLHTWSLAIEEQFYILLPIVILLLRRNARGFVWTLAALFAFSLVVTLLSGDLLHSRDERYFATDLRIWELTLGGLIAAGLRHRRPIRLPLVPLLGLMAIVGPVFIIEGSPEHPGQWALIVCVGTAALLLTGHPAHSWTGQALASRIPRYLGRISYGTYLWHWPIIVFYQYVGGDLNDRSRAAFVVASFALGALSHHLIEAPMRRIPIRANRSRLFGIFALQTAILVTLAAGLYWKSQDSDPAKLSELNLVLESGSIENARWSDCWYRSDTLSTCSFGSKGSTSRPMLLWGDSMSNSALPAFDKFAIGTNRFGKLMVAPSCAPLLNITRDQSNSEECLAMNREAIAELLEAPPTDIILFARWPYYAGGYSNDLASSEGVFPFLDENLNELSGNTFDHFAKALDGLLGSIPDRHRVIIMGPAPEMPESVPQAMITAIRFGHQPSVLTRSGYEDRTRRTINILSEAAARHGTAFLDLTPDFCNDVDCPQSHNGVPIFADHVHLSRLGNDILLQRLKRDLSNLLD